MIEVNVEINPIVFDREGYTRDLRLAMSRAMRAAAREFLLVINSRIPIRTGFLRGAFGTLESVVGSVDTATGAVVPPTNPAAKKAAVKVKLGGLGIKDIHNVPPRWQRRQSALGLFSKGEKRAGARGVLEKQDKLLEQLKKVKGARDITTHQQQTFKRGEYYYPSPPGRHGRKKGVIRGGILKTTTSGQPFATQPGNILKESGMAITFNYAVDISYYAINDRLRGWESWNGALAAFHACFQEEMTKVPNLLKYIYTVKGQSPGTVPIMNYSGGTPEYTPGSLNTIDTSETIGSG